ncbi:hypothetical protein BC938DRAFT_480538 [Jimgerdemannia flammicorona]|uniref:leucine--tRNA ligase n=1 Tax=Jimgerdemannia flammicorona TaxID=994334 RepID=A0A433QIA3_9FUNG|nr:hypothetical protein BC938DRAFT_480538 [Jimgerdemannia flammicorona]
MHTDGSWFDLTIILVLILVVKNIVGQLQPTLHNLFGRYTAVLELDVVVDADAQVAQRLSVVGMVGIADTHDVCDIVAGEGGETAKRDALRALEPKAQKLWEDMHAFEVNAPTIEEHPSNNDLHEAYPKFFGCMAYPYMNGRLHLGHAFTLSKIEFATGYERLKGKRALFPQGFHCTGMPIKACADKLARELELFGQNFENYREPTEDVVEEKIENLTLKDKPVDPTKVVAKKSKVAAKATTTTYQFQIMQQLGVPTHEIHRFADPSHWLVYFPPLATLDLLSFGAKVDWRRSFITTDANPYYDAFVRWQMNRLYQLSKIKFGERYTIYSPVDHQPCMDHDRQSGEGVGPQEYTGIKLEVVAWSAQARDTIERVEALRGKRVFLVAATLRPETMYGQTNCFVGTEINYGLFAVNETDVFLCTERAARNMAYQKLSLENGVVTKLAEIKGTLVVGTKVKAPLSKYEEVYVLPMENVLATKGTGVVTSVPSDSPDDYATLQDLIKKPAYYKIEAEWASLVPIPIINTPTYGDLAAPTICKLKKINSQKDRTQLTEAKELVYKEGFYSGTMIVGDHKGLPVQEAKPRIKEQLLREGHAFVYNEPEGVVMSRSGDECVVALLDQWYLDYGEEEWKKQAEKGLARLNTFGNEIRHQFEQTLGWLNQWACARSFGLGSRLPWDQQFLVESLSDSTIYMAYYTVAHLLHGGSLDGSTLGPAGIKPDEMTDAVWDYVFGLGPYPSDTPISQATLDKLRREYNYFYPLDLRVSGKDLVPNHLTFWIYNHVAIFPEEKWPRTVRANGHLMLNSEKMAKSTGNFLTLHDAIEKYGADASRLALADAGDAVEDANFEDATANAAILRLFTLLEWCEEQVQGAAQLRTGEKGFHDRVFETEMDNYVLLADRAYAVMLYRDALKFGFYELQTARDWYQQVIAVEGMHRDLVMRFVEVQTILLAPITPHWSEHVWREILKKPDSVTNARFPTPRSEVDQSLLEAAEYIRRTVKSVRDLELATQKKKGKGKAVANEYDPTKPKSLRVFVATRFPEWQDAGIEVLRENYNAVDCFIREQATGTFDDVKIRESLAQKDLLKNKKMMPFVQDQKKRIEKFGASSFNRTLIFNEYETLRTAVEFLKRSLGFHTIHILLEDQWTENDSRAAEIAVPGDPGFTFKNEAEN